MKHTKGPWTLTETVESFEVHGPKGTGLIAILPFCEKDAVDRSNAQLIAAAPEMLELLIQCEVKLGGSDKLCHAVQDLIKKARGES